MASFLIGVLVQEKATGYLWAQQNHPETTERLNPTTHSQSPGRTFWHVTAKSSPVHLMTVTRYQSIKQHLGPTMCAETR